MIRGCLIETKNKKDFRKSTMQRFAIVFKSNQRTKVTVDGRKLPAGVLCHHILLTFKLEWTFWFSPRI